MVTRCHHTLGRNPDKAETAGVGCGLSRGNIEEVTEMKVPKTPNAPLNGALARTQTNDIDTPQFTPSSIVCQTPILFLDINLELDACLDAEDLHLRAGREFYFEWLEAAAITKGLAAMLQRHLDAIDKVRRERAILEKGIAL